MASNPLGDAIIWTDDPAEFTIKDGLATCRIRSGGFTFELRSSVAVMLLGLRSAQIAYEAFAEAERTKIARLPDGKIAIGRAV